MDGSIPLDGDGFLSVKINKADKLVSDDAAIVRLDVRINDRPFSFTGVAKRDPHDKPDRDVAALLAYARAYQKLANKLAKTGNGLVKHHDDIREDRRRRREKRKKPARRK